MKTFRTLFSGGELFGVGAQAAGYAHVDGYEIDPKIAAVARLNGFDVRVADVCSVDYESLPAADHLHASPSCKSASPANTKAGETDGDLAAADAICRAIRAHQGPTFSLENVWAYRNFESFARILATLHAYGFVVDFRHINAADYGVPQTRKRLILRAVRRRDHVPLLYPTHRKGGDMFHAPWAGWYAAIADLIDTLPPTEPAPWQLARLPAELRETMLIGPDGHDGLVAQRLRDEPSFTMTATHERQVIRALLVGDQSAGAGAAAYLIDGDNARADSGAPIVRAGVEPAMTLRGGRVSAQRAYVGRWARLTVQALGRFQTVPDSYIGLTAEINGNGIPCLLSRRMMESLLPVYEH